MREYQFILHVVDLTTFQKIITSSFEAFRSQQTIFLSPLRPQLVIDDYIMSTFNSPSARAGLGQSGLFSQRTLLILIGNERVPFHVHPTQLANTAFFEAHGNPTTAADREEQGRDESTVPGMNTPSIEIKQDPDRSPTLAPEPEPTTLEADYVLTGKVLQPAAFEVIVKYLYNQPPDSPKIRAQCRTSLQAYVLALRYNMFGLQDMIVSNFRQYHQEYTVSFEDLLWLVNRLGDSPASHTIPMIRYFADQIAFEITNQGFEKFLDSNSLFHDFLTIGDRPIRAVVFEAVVNIARTIPVDPATGPNKWTVANRTIAKPPSDRDMIQLD